MAVRREQVIRTAEKYVSKGRIDAAIKEYRKVLTSQPGDVNTLNRLGDLYARTQRYDEAVKLFEQIAEGYTEDGFFVKAIAIYKKIIKLDPTRLEIYERLAELYHKQGLINEARTQYQVLADYYTKHNNPTSAINVYRKMAELEPDNPSHHVKLAEMYVAHRLVDKAMIEYATIAELMIDHGHPDDAIQVYTKGLDLDTKNLTFVTNAVLKLKEAGHVGEAARFLAIAVERNPEARKVARVAGIEKKAPPVAEEPEAQPEARAQDVATEEPGTEPELVPEPEAEPEPELEAELDTDVESDLQTELDTEPGTELDTEAELELEESEGGLVLDLDEPGLGLGEALEEAAEAVGGALAAPPDEAEEAAEALQPESAAEAEEDEGDEEDEDAGEMFVLDLEDDEPPASQVQPPPDMLDGRPARAFLREDEREEVAEDEITGTGMEAAEPVVEETPQPQPADLELADLEMEMADFRMTDLETGGPEEAGPSGWADTSGDDRVEVDPEVLERTVSDLEPPTARRDDTELVSEAEVLAKYDMTDKAIERLREALSINPKNLEAHEVLIRIHLDLLEHDDVPKLAARMARTAHEVGDTERWPRMHERLERLGFAFEESAPAGPPTPPPVEQTKKTKSASADRVDRLLQELVGDIKPRRKKRPAPKPVETPPPIEDLPIEDLPIEDLAIEDGAIEKEPIEIAPEPAVQESVEPSPIEDAPLGETPAGETPAEKATEELLALEDDDIVLHGIFDEVPVADTPITIDGPSRPPAEKPGPTVEPPAEAPPVQEPPEPIAAGPDDAGTSWLDEVEEEVAAQRPEAELEEEDDFFDLAGELEQELSREEAIDSSLIQQEQSLEEIVEGFKQGVAENLSPEDHDTHFNLGIAYREMGLLDEAIGEFQVASKSRVHLVECCSMLGLCFLDKGLPELAIKWYRQGLSTPDLNEEEMLVLLYDLGNVYLAIDDKEAAQKTFVELYGVNSNYRDVVAKLEEIKKG